MWGPSKALKDYLEICLTKCFWTYNKSFPRGSLHILCLFFSFISLSFMGPENLGATWALSQFFSLLTFYSLKYIYSFMYLPYTHKHLISKLYPNRLLELQTSLLGMSSWTCHKSFKSNMNKSELTQAYSSCSASNQSNMAQSTNMALLVECSSLFETLK